VHRVSVWEPEGRGLIRSPRHRLEDNINIDLRVIGLYGIYWIHLAQDRH
jgi:hypothetical protein